MKTNKSFVKQIYMSAVFVFEIILHMALVCYVFDFMKSTVVLYLCSFAISSFSGTFLLLFSVGKSAKNIVLCILSACISAISGVIITALIYSGFDMIYRFGNSFDIIIKAVAGAVYYLILNTFLKKTDNTLKT